MARGLLYTLLPLYPKAIRVKAARARRVRPILPSKATELRYRFALNQVVEQCRRAGEDVASGMQTHWPQPAATDGLRGLDAPPPPPGSPLPAHGLSSLLEQAARRFGGIEHQAESMAKLAAQRVLGDVDEKLSENLVRAVGVDISSYLAPTEEIGTALREAATANVELIKSIPSEYLDKVKAAVEKSWTTGQRWESMAAEVKRIGGVTERRARVIARDQTSKMNASFNEVRQTSVGISEYDWSGVRDKRERPSHLAMEGSRQRWDSPPLVDGEHVHPGEAILCFPGDSEIQFAHDVKKAYRRRYHGELAEIVTDSGKALRGTPNHPVLTPNGWLALGQLNEGDYVIEVAEEPLQASEVYEKDRVPLISDVFEAAAKDVPAHSLGLSVEDFHGDGSDGQVDVVLAARPLFVDTVTSGAQCPRKLGLSESANSRFGQRSLPLTFFRVANAACSVMRGISKALALFWRQATHPQFVCLAAGAPLNAALGQPARDHGAFNTKSPGDRKLAFARNVCGDDRADIDLHSVGRGSMEDASTIRLQSALTEFSGNVVLAKADDLRDHPERLPFAQKTSRVIKASRIDGFRGHVYNLETAAGWYVTNGIVTHNCRCAALPRIDFSQFAPGGEEQREAA